MSEVAQWITVHDDGAIDVRVGKVELGQGIVTALAQLAADELGVDLAQVRMRPASTDGPDEGFTAGSMSVADSGAAVRLAAANARELFLRAAGGTHVEKGRITGPGVDTTYAALASLVDLRVPVDRSAPLMVPGPLTGTNVPRLDLPDKVAGRSRFVHDLRLPGQLFGRVVRPPSPGAELRSAEAGPGVVRDGSFLGVVGPDEAAVARAAERLRASARWREHDTLPDENDLDAYLRAGPHDVTVLYDEPSDAEPLDAAAAGTVSAGTVSAGTVSAGAGPRRAGRPGPGGALSLRATYSRPFLAHASIAPSCAVARWGTSGTLHVWSHTQGVHPLRNAIAAALGLDPARVTVEHVEGAGCYGHNGADDVAFDAVLLARSVPGRPVSVQWSRADELAWAPFGSAMTADVAATLNTSGRLTSWSYDVYSQGHTARPGYAGIPGFLATEHVSTAGPGTTAGPGATTGPLAAAVDPPARAGHGSLRNAVPGYDVGLRRIVGHRLLRTPIRSSALRSLGAFLNVYAIESFLDEAAALAGADPLAFRLDHLSDPRGRRVLAAAAEGWGAPLPEGVGRGLGYARYKGRGAYCAVLAEVEAVDDVRVRSLRIAVDVGRVVNPDGVRNQIEGGATQATSWTLSERVRFDRRRITSVTWDDYPILRFSETPRVDVTLVGSPDEPSVGAGEAAQGPTAAAIANAVAAAVGVRVRDLPLTREAVVRAIEAMPPAE
ncbi:molybdopterin cofactor-binding domain-containing protein [Cryptosporangium aurantiacum]|uniref:CO or xanthine dehydrogenase, Mo-binding subunit n=1 Tax=Cryptosporangium aurantiacum TaxID=134849 RepID=A0A1M7RLX0_9ACTN|nr:molybdopterin cofactor-binding domain-containing protein [Cryptosporangium aurantiacum]SHN47317.1 CO or xanthine dehydrogenase, Mo-binding subunit [Cryptosporangium aurantiacum]